MTPLFWIAYGAPFALVSLIYLRQRRKREAKFRNILNEVVASGLTEPPSLHPVVDPMICFGSGACTKACPEEALGIVNGKAQLINPTLCIGHGACAAACPTEAIKLVFGTERRGIDIPYVKPNFETNVPGIFIAGELGGMGLVRKAAEQGRQAMDAIRDKIRPNSQELDVVIVGAGPAGLSASLGAMEKQLRFVTLEQEDSLGGTVYHYPRNKIVMTQPVVLPIIGKAKLGEISKESLLAFWQGIVERVSMPISFNERVEKIIASDQGFVVKTQRSEYATRNVLLAIGRRGTPRKLDVPGEELPKVVYRLIDPEQYANARILVVGGGDSAIEAAVSIANESNSTVTLSYRGEAFGRLKQQNRINLANAQENNKVQVLLNSVVTLITPKTVSIEQNGVSIELENDGVIICAGGILPMPMLKQIGIQVETKFGTE